MESRFNGVPISATLVAPEAASSYKGIRAPITVDDTDFEYSFSSKSQRNSTTSSYYSGSESEGYESGGNEVEKDEKVREDTHFVAKIAVSEPSLRSPDEEFETGSVNVSKNDVFRPYVRIPDGKMFKASSVVDDSDDSGSFLSDSSDELGKDESFVAQYSDSRPLVAVIDEAIAPVVDVRVPLVPKLHIPIAQISADSDDDSQISGVSEEEGFSGIVRVPSIEVLRRIDSTPKVRVLESEGDDNESRAEKIVEMEFVDDLVIGDGILGSLDEVEHLNVKSSINSSVSGDLVLDKGPEVGEEDTTNSLVVDEEFDSTSESGKNGDDLHLGLEIQESDVADEVNQSEKVESEYEHEIVTTIEVDEEFDSTFESGKDGDNLLLDVEIQESYVIDVGNRSEKVESETEHKAVTTIEVDEEFDSTLESGMSGDNLLLDVEIQDSYVIDVGNRSEKVESETEHKAVTTIKVDEEFDSTLESGKNGDHLHSNVEIQEIDEGNRSEKVESENDEDEIVTTVESFSMCCSNAAHEISSVHQCVDIVESSKLYMFDSLFKDGRLSSESVSECSEDHEIWKEAEMNSVPDSNSFSNGEILSESQQIDCQIVPDSPLEVDADGETSDHAHLVDPANFEAVRRDVLNEGIIELSPIEGIANVEDSSETKNKIEQIRVNYLRLAHRLGHLDSTKKAAIELAPQRTDDLDFSLSILVIGETGVGKSATINSIFGETMVDVNAFEPGTSRVEEIVGTINGVKLKVFDTPGLRTCSMDLNINRKILSCIKKLMQKSPPDVILYVDRLDTQTSLHDLPVLKVINSYLGSSLWGKSIIAFTHGAWIPPDGPHGCRLRYEAFVAQQSRAVRQIISNSMVPVCLVENHPSVEKNGLHNGERWRSQFLLLCCSVKILAEFKNAPPKLVSSYLHSKVVSDVALCRSYDSDPEDSLNQETGAPEMWVPRSVTASSRVVTGSVGWDRAGIADDFASITTVQFTKNVSAVFNGHLCGQICVRTRCSDLHMAALVFVPIIRAVFKKFLGHSSTD